MIRSALTALAAAAALLTLPALASAAPPVLDGTGQLDPATTAYQYESGVITPDGAYAYYGWANGNGPSTLIKVRLSDLTRVDTLTLSATRSDGEWNQFLAAAINAAGTYAYFGSNDDSPMLIKVRLSDFTVVARGRAVGTGNANRGGINKVLLSSDGATAYTLMNNGWLIKIDTASMAVLGELYLKETTMPATSVGTVPRGVISPDGSILYLTGNADNEPGVARVLKVQTSDLTRIGVMDFPGMGVKTETRSLSPNGAHLYIGVASTPRKILKVQTSDLSTVGTATLPNAITSLATSTISTDGSELFVSARPSTVYRIDTATMTVGDSLDLQSNTTFCPVSDWTVFFCPALLMLPSPDGQYLYATNRFNEILRLRVQSAPSGNGGNGGGSSGGPSSDSGTDQSPAPSSGAESAPPAVASTPVASTPAATLRVPQSRLQGGSVQQQVTTSGPGRVTIIVTRNGKLVCRSTQQVRGAVKVSIGCAAPAKGTKSTLTVLTAFVPTTGKGVAQKSTITQKPRRLMQAR